MNFEFKLEGIEEAKKMISPRLFNEVLKYTIQDIAKGARVAIKDKIREGYNIRPSDLNAAMKVRTGRNPLEQIIRITDADKRGIPMFKLAGRAAVQTREGVWAEVRKGRAQAFTQAFISIMGSGHKGVFVRFKGGTGKGGRMTRKDMGGTGKGGRWSGRNPPIHEIYGPRITSLVGGRVINETLKKFLKDNAQRIFKQKLNWKTGGMLGR